MRHARLFPLAILGVLATMACQARPDFPLAQAVDSGERAQIRMLLDRGTDLEEAGGDGWRAVIWAVRQDHPDILRELLAAGADPNAPATRRNGWTPLMHAIHTRQSAEGPTARLGAIQTLLDGGADPNGRSRKGSTPLIMAAGYGATDMVALLLEAGADPRLQTPGGETALRAAVTGANDIDHFTLGQCQTDTVEVMLAQAPDLRLGDRFGDRLALRLAQWRGCRDVVRLVADASPVP